MWQVVCCTTGSIVCSGPYQPLGNGQKREQVTSTVQYPVPHIATSWYYLTHLHQISAVTKLQYREIYAAEVALFLHVKTCRNCEGHSTVTSWVCRNSSLQALDQPGWRGIAVWNLWQKGDHTTQEILRMFSCVKFFWNSLYLQLLVQGVGFPLDVEFQCHWELPFHCQHLVV